MRKFSKRKVTGVMLCLLFLLMQGNSSVLGAELVHHWTLDETDLETGTVITDIISGKNGTVQGAGVTAQEGMIGGAIHFAGNGDNTDNGDHISIASFSTADIKDMTLSFWMNMDEGTIDSLANGDYQRIISASDGFEIMIQADNTADVGKLGNNLYKTGGKAGYPLTTEVMPEGEWVHVACTASLSTAGGDGLMTIYLNGELDNSMENASTVDWSGGQLRFAHRPGSAGDNHYSGLLDDIRIYNGVLTAEEIKAIYDSAMSGPEAIFPMPLPDEGGKNIPEDITFQWTYTEDADVAIGSYTIFMDTDSALVAEPNLPSQEMLIDGTGDATNISPASGEDPSASYTYASKLAKDEVYYWKIVANIFEPNAADPNLYDVPNVVASPVWSFSTITTGPVANAGSNVITWLVDGTATYQPDASVTDETNDIKSIQWSVVQQPEGAVVSFDPADSADTTISLNMAGEYEVKLFADDHTGNEAEDMIKISVYSDSCDAAQNNSQIPYIPLDYDLDNDCKVNIADFALMAELWLEDNSLTESVTYEKAAETSIPTVFFTYPENNAILSGIISDPIRVNAVAYSIFDETMTDSTGISHVWFYLINSESIVVASKREGIVTYDWQDFDTTAYPDGTYTLRAVAFGNTFPEYSSQAEITIIIDNAQ